MRLFPVLAPVIAALAHVGGSAPDPCRLLPLEHAAALLGVPAVQAVAAPPEKDDDTGGMLSYCTFRATRAPKGAVLVTVTEFASDAQARKQATKQLVTARMDDEATVREEGSVGEKTFWATSETGAMVVFLRRNAVVGVALGGPPGLNPATHKAELFKAAQAVAAAM